jgi:uncharacterized membrane protein
MTSTIFTTVLIAMAPVSELRGAIPFGIFSGIPPAFTYLLAVFGNFLPVFPLLYFLKYGSEIASKKSAFVRKVLEWVFARTRKKHGEKFETFGFWALLVFVAVPLPLTGAWTGAVIAYLIGMPIKKAGFAILGGVALSGAIVLALTVGFTRLF